MSGQWKMLFSASPNYFRMPLHNGTVEGLNKAKVLSHKACGFRAARTYTCNLYHCVAELPVPKTLHTFVC